VRASSHEQSGEDHSALEDYNRAIQLSSDFQAAYLGRAKVYYRLGSAANYQNAIADYTEFINKAHDTSGTHDLAVAYDGRGQAYFKVNELDKAQDDFEQAIKLDERFAQPSYDLGLLFAQKHQLDEAIKSYTQAIMSDAEFYPAYLGRGEAYYWRGKSANRQEDLQSAFDDFSK